MGMRIKRLYVHNIRCFKKAEIHLSPTITLVAGENNSGKTTLIQAMHLLQSNNALGAESIRFGANDASIFVELDNIDLSFFANDSHQFPDGLSHVAVRARFSTENHHSSILLETPKAHIPFKYFPDSQPGNFLIPYLSDRRAGGFAEHIGAQYAHRAGGTLLYLSSKVDRCLTSEELGPMFRNTCKEVFGFVISTQPMGSGKMAGLEINARRQQFIPLAHLGSGIAQALGLIVELLVAENKVFLIEELENDLHPTALRALLSLIERSASTGNQFVISTHSNIVLRRLGSVNETKTYHTNRVSNSLPPESTVTELQSEPAARIGLLRSLGYDLSDYELYDAWLVLEESSAERIIREFIIPWFAPKLSGRIRSLAAGGASDVEPRFADLHRLFVFTHLEPIYAKRAWVIVDGDEAGQDALRKLRDAFKTWDPEHFCAFSKAHFEDYYPDKFSAQVQQALAIPDTKRRRTEKALLVEDVCKWLRADPQRGRKALELRATEVIRLIQKIESQIAP